MTILSSKTDRQAVVFKKKVGCPKCKFLDIAIGNSTYANDIEAIYLEDHDADAFHELGIMSTPVMAIIENGEIVEKDPNVMVAEQLEEFMNKL